MIPTAYHGEAPPPPADLLTLDFETYSEAGYVFDHDAQRWRYVPDTPSSCRSGLAAVGVWNYASHPTTEILTMSWAINDGPAGLWVKGMPPPPDLLEWVRAGGLVEAHNSFFEWCIWEFVAHRRMGWPRLWYTNTADSMAKCYAFSLPGSLEKAGGVLALDIQKQAAEGKRLIKKFSGPRNPTKKNPSKRLQLSDAPLDAVRFGEYNRGDVLAERALSHALPELQTSERDLWLIDQRVNIRGVAIDVPGVHACAAVIRQARLKYERELHRLTGGAVETSGQRDRIIGFCGARGVMLAGLTDAHVSAALASDRLPDDVRRVLEIRAVLASASVKKVFALERQVGADGRLHGVLQYCGAQSTGRWAGRGPQPQNMPGGFGVEETERALGVIGSGSLAAVEEAFGDPFDAVSGCLRGLFIGHDLMGSDYSAIEAVVLAALAGEEWRLEVFRTHGMIYEASAGRIAGMTIAEFVAYREAHGEHHPLRGKLGKPAELGGGFGGGLGAWKAFGAGEFMSDDEIQANVKAWRQASPNIVKFWYGLRDAAHSAVTYPGQWFEFRGVMYGVVGDVLYCRLLSGRYLHYLQPRLVDGKYGPVLEYSGQHAKYGWTRLDAWYGLLTENVVQATARDILAHALKNLERAGYPVVLHVHDEAVAEPRPGFGSVEQFEEILADVPDWCRDWPIKAAGGWRGLRYRKG